MEVLLGYGEVLQKKQRPTTNSTVFLGVFNFLLNLPGLLLWDVSYGCIEGVQQPHGYGSKMVWYPLLFLHVFTCLCIVLLLDALVRCSLGIPGKSS